MRVPLLVIHGDRDQVVAPRNGAALASIASAVHFLDAGGIPVADACGLETMLRGITHTARNDDEKVSKANGVFDHLYAAYSGDSKDS